MPEKAYPKIITEKATKVLGGVTKYLVNKVKHYQQPNQPTPESTELLLQSLDKLHQLLLNYHSLMTVSFSVFKACDEEEQRRTDQIFDDISQCEVFVRELKLQIDSIEEAWQRYAEVKAQFAPADFKEGPDLKSFEAIKDPFVETWLFNTRHFLKTETNQALSQIRTDFERLQAKLCSSYAVLTGASQVRRFPPPQSSQTQQSQAAKSKDKEDEKQPVQAAQQQDYK